MAVRRGVRVGAGRAGRAAVRERGRRWAVGVWGRAAVRALKAEVGQVPEAEGERRVYGHARSHTSPSCDYYLVHMDGPRALTAVLHSITLGRLGQTGMAARGMRCASLS